MCEGGWVVGWLGCVTALGEVRAITRRSQYTKRKTTVHRRGAEETKKTRDWIRRRARRHTEGGRRGSRGAQSVRVREPAQKPLLPQIGYTPGWLGSSGNRGQASTACSTQARRPDCETRY